MDIEKYPDSASVEAAVQGDEQLMAVISFDGTKAVVSQVDEAVVSVQISLGEDRQKVLIFYCQKVIRRL